MTERLTRLLTVRQAAELVGVHPQTIRKAIRLGQLEERRVGLKGAGVRVPEDSLLAWTQRGQQGEAEAPPPAPEPVQARAGAPARPRRRVLSRGVG